MKSNEEPMIDPLTVADALELISEGYTVDDALEAALRIKARADALPEMKTAEWVAYVRATVARIAARNRIIL